MLVLLVAGTLPLSCFPIAIVWACMPRSPVDNWSRSNITILQCTDALGVHECPSPCPLWSNFPVCCSTAVGILKFPFSHEHCC